jgi:hypothetical protein
VPVQASLADLVEALAPPLDQWKRFLYVDRLVGGETFGLVDHFPGVPWLPSA